MAGLVMDALDQLPPLRQELSLHPGPTQDDGTPSWTLHDPAANRFYQLSWQAFELLTRWPLGQTTALLAAVNSQTTLRLQADDVAALCDFLVRHHLLQTGTPEHTAQLSRVAQASRPGQLQWLLRHYLFFRVPLLRPMPILKRLAPAFALVFTPGFWWAVAAMALCGLFLVSRRWDEFTHTFSAYGGVAGLVGIGLSLSFAKLLHEFGHALTAQRFGCRVPSMGVAFLVLVPVLYTDTNEAWKLPRRRQRLLIGAAGMLAELVLAALATLLWSFLPDSPLRAGVFMLATTAWVATLAINASPFMRFDGYFLLSDWLNLPNLHGRAFALTRWALRRALLGWDAPPPEHFTPGRQRFLVLFGLATWLYRLVLFLSIALLVYHLFFKLLGLLLLAVELGYFIVRPILSELSVWWRQRAALRWCYQTCRSSLLLLALLPLLALPWQSRTGAPAMLGASQAQSLHAPALAEVESIAAQDGEWVRQGQLLLQLRSPELESQLAQAGSQARLLRWQLEQQAFNSALQQLGPALSKQWQSAQEKVAGLQRQREQLAVRAPFDGRIVDANPALQVSAVIAPGERLLQVVGDQGVKGEAFVGEAELARLQAAGSAVFMAQRLEQPRWNCRIGEIDRLPLTALDQPALASAYGGPIATQRADQRLVPLQALFRVRILDCQDDTGQARAPLRELPGLAQLQSQGHSLLVQAWLWLTAALQAEAAL